jgi:hypothetical protein
VSLCLFLFFQAFSKFWACCSTHTDRSNKRKSVLKVRKVRPRTDHEGPAGKLRYKSTLSLTPALDEGGWSTLQPGGLTRGRKTRYPFFRRLGWFQGLSWCAHTYSKISPQQPHSARFLQHIERLAYIHEPSSLGASIQDPHTASFTSRIQNLSSKFP